MHFLALSIICSTIVLIIFRMAEQFRISTLPIIVINYFTATILGFTLSGVFSDLSFNPPLFFYVVALIIGSLFLIFFLVTAASSQQAGIAITSVAAKMSVIFPISFSIIIDPADKITLLKLAGIMLALAGVFFTVFKKSRLSLNARIIYLPIALFLGMGLVDSLMKLAQQRFVDESNLVFFSAILFGMAALLSIPATIARKIPLRTYMEGKTLLTGIFLGLVNLGTVYFIISALSFKMPDGNPIDSSVIFGINNVGVVFLSVLAGLLIFAERLTRLNIIGIFLSVAAIIVLAYSGV
jgi:drug/metabolite transporter (DMT)-like permease